MKKIICTVLLLAGFAVAVDFSGDTLLSPGLKKLIDAVPPHDSLPDASFYIITDSTIAKALPGGGYEIETYYLAKAYTYRGKKKLSNYKIRFNDNYEDVELLRARTINGDVVVPVDSTEVNQIVLPSYSDATMYAKIMQLVVSLPAFNESSAVEIHYKIRSKRVPPVPFGGMKVLLNEEPARKVFYAVGFSQGQKPKWKSISGAPKPVVSGGQIQWTISDWAGVQYEPQIPPVREIMPTVLYTFSQSWEDESEKIAQRLLKSTVADSAVMALAESLSAGKSQQSAAEALLFHLQEKFKHIYISPNLVGYDPNPASVVLSNGYGDSRDMAVLLIAMLGAVGIRAYPALVATSGARIVDIPTVHQFSRIVVAADIKGKTVFLDPMQQYVSPNYLGAPNGEKAFLISPGNAGLVDIPPIEPNKNSAIFTYNMELDESGSIAGEVSTQTSGTAARELRSMFRHAKKRKKKQRIESAASDVADGAKIDGKPIIEGMDTNSDEPRIQFALSAPEFLTIQEDMAILWLPKTPFTPFALPDISKETRQFPLFISQPMSIAKYYTFHFPENYKVDYIPPILQYENEVGTLTIGSQSGEYSLSINIILEIKQKRISPDDYELLKQLIKSVSAKRYRIVLLEKE